MFVAVLSPYPGEIAQSIEATGDIWKVFNNIEEVANADFVISYGHRRLIRKSEISRFRNRLINLHISYLPWNRGADPNLWSFIDGTPKGVTIHLIDEGIDTGSILTQCEIFPHGTLATSYQQLRAAMQQHFADVWADIRDDKITPRLQNRHSGSYHSRAEKMDIWSKLPLGYETSIEEVEIIGRAIRFQQASENSFRYKKDAD